MLIWFLLISVLLVASVLVLNEARSRREFDYQLKPNCLLTRYPIVFVAGYRTLFYSVAYWNYLPEYLREHGYDINQLNLAWRPGKKRAEEWRYFCDFAAKNHASGLHLIVDESLAAEIAELFPNKPDWLKSLTLVESESAQKSFHVGAQSLRPLAYEIFTLPNLEPYPISKTDALLWRLHQLSLYPHPVPSISILCLGQTARLRPLFDHYLDLCVSLAERDMR